MLPDWLKNLAPLSQPIRGKTKTNRDLLTRVSPRLVLHVFASSSNWFIGLSVSVVIGQSDYLVLVLRHSIENLSNGEKCVESGS